MKIEPCPFCGSDVTKITDVPCVDDWIFISDDTAESYCPSCGGAMEGEKDDKPDKP